MTRKILIDASHAEETRVVVLDGNRLEDFDVETANRRQIKGNIYLAKVIRVEPSLQAAFVEYGGNRHGFLAFGEIHPDYYQIPVADRKKLLAMQAEEADEEDAAAERQDRHRPRRGAAQATGEAAETDASENADAGAAEAGGAASGGQSAQPLQITPIEIHVAPPPADEAEDSATPVAEDSATPVAEAVVLETMQTMVPEADPASHGDAGADDAPAEAAAHATAEPLGEPEIPDPELLEPETAEPEIAEPEIAEPESLGGDGDDAAEARERRQRQRFLRNYKIQEVIHRRQIMLIQVVKEERGNKGAALTTYLSLAGRYSVLMPNSPSGGGVSRKITSLADRRRLKEAMAELDVPEGMGLIVRTAGANRPKPEIVRDCEYLLRLWDDIRERTMESTAPAQIYEEASLIKRTIRDVYTRDVEEILVDGDEGYQAARDFMRMLMPAHARKVQFWSEGQPLFARHQVEAQLDAMLSPTVQLRSGGYIVINQTEALVAIDVNSGRSTRERSIEDTALRTNLEAADEAARQLRMRDLAGLVVIDFIDMESRKNNASVERRMKDALKSDRARIQVGPISHFGLMELSRQRLRPSLAEASMMMCPHCQGQGHLRSPESAALHILRAIEDEGAKFRAAEIAVYLPPEIAFYLFNHKRERLSAIEARYGMRVMFTPDAALTGTNFRIEKVRAQVAAPATAAPASYGPASYSQAAPATADEEDDDSEESDEAETESEGGETDSESAETGTPRTAGTEEGGRRRRRRRRGKRRDGEAASADDGARPAGDAIALDPSQAEQPSAFDAGLEAELVEPGEGNTESGEDEPARRRRSRGGRRRRGEGEAREPARAPAIADNSPPSPAPAAMSAPESTYAPAAHSAPVYTDIADIFEAAERAEAEARERREQARAAPPASAPVSAAQTPEPQAPTLAEPAPEPLVKPVLINDPAGLEKKRGWWRR